MTKKYCRVCGCTMDDPKDITHYRVCVRRKDWPGWVRNGTEPTVTVEAMPAADGSERAPIVLTAVTEDEPEAPPLEIPEGAMLAFSEEGSLLCECGWIGKNAHAYRVHRGVSKLHKEAVPA